MLAGIPLVLHATPPVDSPEMVLQTVATAVGVRERRQEDEQATHRT